ncbi:MAG TPA: iron ABC transporter permease [Kiritimatiellia bacterium]|nr:iron ABC transporter permease [Kiritimatiellia bacterium]HSA18158.1 iron ABC transporter permease [Kiritimatiellia bacterium]
MNKQRIFIILVFACPLLVALGLFLGHGWSEPASLFEPARRGILEARLWRVALGAVTGAALSVSGVILQALLRNPLAEPYVLGLSAGSGLATALGILLGGLAFSSLMLPAAGFVGGLVSLAIVWRLASAGRITGPHTLVLAGVVWGSLCGSLLMFIVSQASVEGLHAVLWWLLGDLQVFDTRLVLTAAAIVLPALAAAALLARDLDVLLLGEEMAGHVGLNAERAKIIFLALAALLTAASVCISGLIGFVGLTAPHAARALVGPNHRRLVPAAALLGAAFLVLADGLGRTLFYPVEIPIGVITSLVGAPFFLLLLRRKQKEMWR